MTTRNEVATAAAPMLERVVLALVRRFDVSPLSVVGVLTDYLTALRAELQRRQDGRVQ